MEFIPKNRLLEFRADTLESLRKQYNLDKPGEMDRAIDVLEAWIKMQNHFMRKEFPREYLEKSIIVNKGSIERAKIKLDKICTYRTIMPDFFGENLSKNTFEDISEFISALLPQQTDSNCRVILLKQTAKTFTVSQVLNYYRLFILICEYIMAHDYCNGMVCIGDYRESNMVELVKALSLTDLRQISAIITEAFGMRLAGIHVITTSKAVETLVTILKQFLSAKIGDRISVHKDMTTMYQYVPKELWPSEYGGKEKSILNMHSDLMEELTREDFRAYIEDMNKATTDESCRQTDKFNEQYMGTPGSFRTLTMD